MTIDEAREKEAFIQYIEICIDYNDPISDQEIELYKKLIEERERMIKNESSGIK